MMAKRMARGAPDDEVQSEGNQRRRTAGGRLQRRRHHAGRRSFDPLRPPRLPQSHRGPHHHAAGRRLGMPAGGAVIAFLGGLMAGSFVTVVAHRVPRGESIVGPRSRCPACGVQIAAYDNVPVFSWLALRGRARCCGVAISAGYPITELALGLLYATTVLALWDEPGEVALGLVFVTVLMAVTLTDLERRIIP